MNPDGDIRDIVPRPMGASTRMEGGVLGAERFEPPSDAAPHERRVRHPKRDRVLRRVFARSGAILGLAAVAMIAGGWVGWVRTPELAEAVAKLHPSRELEAEGPILVNLPKRVTTAMLAGWLNPVAGGLVSPIQGPPPPVPTSEVLVRASAELDELVFQSWDVDRGRGAEAANRRAIATLRWLGDRRSWQIQNAVAAAEARSIDADSRLKAVAAEMIEAQRDAGRVDLEKETPAHLQDWVAVENRRHTLRTQLETLEAQMEGLIQEMGRQSPDLIAVREALRKARLQFTEEHPKVRELRAAVAGYEERMAGSAKPVSTAELTTSDGVPASLYLQWIGLRQQHISTVKSLEETEGVRSRLQGELASIPARQLDYLGLKSRYQRLRTERDACASQWQALTLLAREPSVAGALVRPADPLAPRSWRGWAGAAAGSLGAGLAALLAAAGVAGITAWRDQRIRGARELESATGLPVIATLEDLKTLGREARETWGMRTFARFRHAFSTPGTDAMVCGFISSQAGEGRSTWIKLLAQAAARQGCQVLTICTWKSRFRTLTESDSTAGPAAAAERALQPLGGGAWDGGRPGLVSGDPPVVQLPLAEWVWSAERRQEWQRAFDQWKRTPNLVVLVELPPASVKESLLLAESVPHMVWLCGDGMADAQETQEQLQTLKHSNASIAGAVLNRPPTRPDRPPLRKRRRRPRAGLSLLLGLVLSVLCAGRAQETPGPAAPGVVQAANDGADEAAAVGENPGAATGALQASTHPVLADWQKRLTLGPGDVVNLSLYGVSDSLRPGLTVGPDGRLSYLQAENLMVVGLTIDELRAKLEEVLGKFYIAPRVVARPVAHLSKKVYLLGNVVQKGVLPLERPISVLEAVAQARGFIPSQQRDTLNVADFGKSFLVRRNGEGLYERVGIDFEALFLRGDLSQNKALAPDDYLFFAPADVQEVFILGQVLRPGVTPFAEKMGILQAIVLRGGYTPKAFRARVLVIRGSLTQPQRIIVDMNNVVRGKAPDFALQSGDIVFVSQRPWIKAEELLESAVQDFLRASIISWTGRNIGPFIKEPIF